ncbi:MAG: metallophosphoesterase [Nitrososphaerales archaeon]
MKIKYGSDIHLEFRDCVIKNTDNSDVLILAGDILVCELYHTVDFGLFIDICCDEFNHVIMVFGNHEFYHSSFKTAIPELKKKCSRLKNLYILDQESVIIDGINFVGATLWTDCRKSNPSAICTIKNSMNDFVYIKNGKTIKNDLIFGEILVDSKLTPEDTIIEHKNSLNKFDELITDLPTIVVTHHAPTFNSIPDEFKHLYELNGGYASDLSEFILDRPSIKYWIHGHVHTKLSYNVGDTIVLCNPRGYPNQNPNWELDTIII